MKTLYLTDDKKIFDALSHSNFNILLTNIEYKMSINQPGKRVAAFEVNHQPFNIVYTRYSKDSIDMNNNVIQQIKTSTKIINAFKPNLKSQFNFDMLINTINPTLDLVYRLWSNDIEFYNSYTLQDEIKLPLNIDFKDMKSFYMANKIIDSYWANCSFLNPQQKEMKLKISEYYILNVLLIQSEEIRTQQSNLYYTYTVKHLDISGYLSYDGTKKFNQYDIKHIEQINTSSFQILKYHKKERFLKYPLLFTHPTLIKRVGSDIYNNEVLNTLFEKGFITNPNTHNYYIPKTIVSYMIDTKYKFDSRYSNQMSFIKEHGISDNKLDEHITINYVNDNTNESDKTHAILPIPKGNINDLTEVELEVYDIIVLRYLSIFLKAPHKATIKVEAVNNKRVNLILKKDVYLRYGSDIFEMRKDDMYSEVEDNILNKYSFFVGQELLLEDLKIALEGKFDRQKKPLSNKQLVARLINMGKKNMPRHLINQKRHYIIGFSESWRYYIENLTKLKLIEIDDDNCYCLTKLGYEIIDCSKSYIINIRNINSLFIQLIKIQIGSSDLLETVIKHVETIESIKTQLQYSKTKPINYNYIIHEYKCPLCQSTLTNHNAFLGCSNYRQCKFSLSKILSSGEEYRFSELELVELLTKRETSSIINGFVFRSNKKGNVRFKYTPPKKISYIFENK